MALEARGDGSSVAFSPDGQRLAIVTGYYNVRLWDIANRWQIRLFVAPGILSSVAFSPGGAELAAASHDGTVRLWSTETGKEIATLKGHSAAANCVAFSNDGSLLASGGSDWKARLWSTKTWHQQAVLTEDCEIRSVAFSPDGSKLATAGSGESKSAGLWDVGTSHKILELRGHTQAVHSVDFSPDGRLLATAGLDGTVRLWSVAAGVEVRTLRTGAQGGVITAAFSRDGKYIAVSHGGLARIYGDEGSGWGGIPLGRDREIFVQFSHDGRELVTYTGLGKSVVWDARSLSELSELEGRVIGAGFSMDDSLVVLFRSLARDQQSTVQSPGYSLSFSDSLCLWDVKASRSGAVAALGDASPWKFLLVPDGRTVVIQTAQSQSTGNGSADFPLGMNQVDFWAADSLRKLRTLQSVEKMGDLIAASPDGKILVTVGGSANSSAGGAPTIATLRDSLTLRELGTLRSTNGLVEPGDLYFPSKGPTATKYSPDGKILAMSVGATAAKFSPDGKILATAFKDGTIKLWDVPSREEIATLRGHVDGVTSLAFSPDGRRLASGSIDRMVKLWDTGTLQEVLTITGFEAALTCLDFSPDGRTLAAASEESPVRLFRGTDERIAEPPRHGQ
jgi:WD40 repeat protein